MTPTFWYSIANATSIASLYQALLNRTPDPTGLAGWPGLRVCDVADAIGGGAEFAADNPVCTDDLVTKLYSFLLNRAPDPAASGWVGQPGTVVYAGIRNSPEFAGICPPQVLSWIMVEVGEPS